MERVETKSEILIGIDYGDTNIGIAFGRNGLASPIKVISGKDPATAVCEITKVLLENQAEKVIIGLPYNENEKETDQTRRIRHFARLLKTFVKKPIIFVNEYGTSTESLNHAIKIGMTKKSRRKIDHFSAAYILRKYYEEQDIAP